MFRFIGEAVDLVDGLVNDPSKASTVDLFTQAIYIGIAATGLNILTGYNGQVSLGHGAFFGLGAYTSAILHVRPRLELPADVAGRRWRSAS